MVAGLAELELQVFDELVGGPGRSLESLLCQPPLRFGFPALRDSNIVELRLGPPQCSDKQILLSQ
jgi:hypothetical protein